MIPLLLLCAVVANPPALGISGSRFTLDGQPVFLLGISYYGALGIETPKQVQRDLDAFKKCGFNWVRVWATWNSDAYNVGAVAPDGSVRTPYLDRLKFLCRAAAKRRMLVDVTVTRGKSPGFPGNLDEHQKVMAALAENLKEFGNLYFDVGNERNIGDARHVPMVEVGRLIETVKAIDPDRLCTASHGGDIAPDEVVAYLRVGKVDLLCPHRPRTPESPAQTADMTRRYLAAMQSAPRIVPVHYQEPFRRGYGEWEPAADDFLRDLKAAREGGAAGWCFHNGPSRHTRDGRPRHSFDMRPAEGRLLDQLDGEERRFMSAISTVPGNADRASSPPRHLR